MEYYKIGQDNRIPYGALITKLNNIGGYYEAKKGNLSVLDRVIVSFVNPSPLNFYPDILDRQLFMIKGAVKEVFDLFLPDLQYKHCCLLDKPNNSYELYFIPILTQVEPSHEIPENMHIFRQAEKKKLEVIASLEVVEAILRRHPKGISIVPA